MKYERVHKASFLSRPNRFIAYVKGLCEDPEQTETVHVKNTGRCAELLIPGAEVYVQKTDNPSRKTKWDLIAVKKDGQIINMDSQVPNKAVKEWLEEGNFIPGITKIRPEYTYGSSRIDLYVEAEERKILMEIKGVTLKEGRLAKFPDAPSERAVRHMEELMHAVEEGYEAYAFFVIQMKDVDQMMPNVETHPEFADVLCKAREKGVHLAAYDCIVSEDEIRIDKEIPVVLPGDEKGGEKNNGEDPISILSKLPDPLIRWFRGHKRDLPWRNEPSAYHVWVSEIMLQQTRVEAVKPFYARFLEAFPTIRDLAEAQEEKLLKLWEGLGYYNRVRNMQKAARQIMEMYDGEIPADYEKILSLTGIGSYTAGAISSFAFGIPKPAVDGNVLRVLSRILADDADISKASVKKRAEEWIEAVIPEGEANDFNQGLIELGAIVCVPNGEPKCSECPAREFCLAHQHGIEMSLPVKKKAKARRIEEKTILIFKDGDNIALCKRPKKGLLAGLFEFPNLEGFKTMEEVAQYSRQIGLSPLRIESLPEAKHIFSHVEWHMKGFAVRVDELEKSCTEDMLFVHPEEIQRTYAIPAAFETYTGSINVLLGQEKYEKIEHLNK
ncbi:MAG: A/G-specific adenine glycosylase [Sellimonas sp.]|uniref:A/G-specific adenine glycosylase n=1 Tax=Sellimonas sp. TaxID=2021466 RepID=UPI0039A23F12